MNLDPANVPSHLAKLPLGDWRVPLCQDKDEIRLVWLMPGAWDDPIKCQLRVVSLGEIPPYSALSYVWGDATRTEPIVVNGDSFHVTTNLKIALQYLRHRRLIRVLWVDALCIHQTSHAEKAWQVDMMGQIFSKCINAVFWLGREREYGDPSPPGDLVLNDYSHVSLALKVIHDLVAGLHLKDIYGPDITTKQQIQDFHALVCYGWNVIRHRPWWQRVWTLQEAVMPNEAILKCGVSELRWSVLQQLEIATNAHAKCCRSKILHLNPTDLPTLRNQVRAVRLLRNSKRRNFPLLYIHSAQRDATNSLDKIYGLIGMFQGDLQLYSDYNVEPTELCISLTKQLLLRARPSHNLFAMKRQTELADLMPSWVIDFITLWGKSSRRVDSRLKERQQPSPFSSSDIVIEDHLLSSSAYVVGHINRTVIKPLRNKNNLDLCLSEWRKLVDSCTHGPYEDLIAAFWDTIFGTSHSFPTSDKSSWIAQSESINENGEREISIQNIRLLNEVTHTSLKYFIDRRNFFITDHGYFGLGPAKLEVNDKIVILHGVSTPLVIRQTEALEGDKSKLGEKPCYKLIGDCYIHGLMAGEVVSLDFATVDTIFII